MNIYAFGEYTDEQIKAAYVLNTEIIERHKGQHPPQPASFWKAVENRNRLRREMKVRNLTGDAGALQPKDVMPLFNSEMEV